MVGRSPGRPRSWECGITWFGSPGSSNGWLSLEDLAGSVDVCPTGLMRGGAGRRIVTTYIADSRCLTLETRACILWATINN